MRHKQLQIAIETTTKEHHVLFCDIVLIMVGAEGLAFVLKFWPCLTNHSRVAVGLYSGRLVLHARRVIISVSCTVL